MISTRSRSEPSPLDESLRDRIRREIEMDMRLKRIEEKLDSIIAVIAARETEGKEDDDKAFALLSTLATQAIKSKAGVPAKSGGFANL